MNIIFLDIDGVLNCQLLHEKQKVQGGKGVDHDDYYSSMLCKDRISWLNKLCVDANAKVVISSTWRLGKTLEWLQKILKINGATFDIIDTTPILKGSPLRGNEILAWIKNNNELLGCNYYDFYTYAIIDDDSDMLLWQKDNFFQTDGYAGLTPNTCYKIKRFFEKFKVNWLIVHRNIPYIDISQ